MRLRLFGLVLAASSALLTSGVASAASAPPDPWITTQVKIAPLTATGVRANDVNVDTTEGRVTLHGSLTSAAAKARALDVAKSVEGVRTVRNQLQIVPEAKRDAVVAKDEQIRDTFAERLDAREVLDDAEVSVEVSNSVARLSGTEKSQVDRLAGLTTARAVPGVRSVIGDLRVEGAARPAVSAR